MISPAAEAIGFAVADGQPADARNWITIDFDGHLTPHRRGYLVLTEPTERTPYGLELASRVRELLLNDLRRQQNVSVDLAIGRAFASANDLVYQELTSGEHAGFDRRIFIGATVMVIQHHSMTIGHVPPGQTIIVEDGLVYAVPDLDSWLPGYHEMHSTQLGSADPLGYALQVRPALAETELRPGDVISMLDSRTADELAHRLSARGEFQQGLRGLFGRDPDDVLKIFRDVIIEHDIDHAAVAVLALPPIPGSLQIQTLGDVARRARDEWRSASGFLSEWVPVLRNRENPFSSGQPQPPPGPLKPIVDIPKYAISSTQESAKAPIPVTLPDGVRSRAETGIAERKSGPLQRLRDRREARWTATWKQPGPLQQFGVPGAHGVQLHRNTAAPPMGEPTWRRNLPRMPLVSVGLLWVLIAALVAGMWFGGTWLLDQRNSQPQNYASIIAQIDKEIVDALSIADEDARTTALEEAMSMVEEARDRGAPESELTPRELKISQELDVLENIIRFVDVQRIGTLPQELHNRNARVVHTLVGTFIVGGNLYQLHPDTRELELILSEGDVIEMAIVGDLFGVAADATGIYVTDGRHLFIRDLNNQWIATELQEMESFGPWSPAPLDAFGGNVYLLQPGFLDIYRFEALPDNGVAVPEPWVSGGARDGLGTAVDIAIDGNIYVLLDTGEVRTYRQGDMTDVNTPGFISEELKPVALLNGGATGYLYVVCVNEKQGTGKVLAWDNIGLTTWQLELPTGFEVDVEGVNHPFEGFQDFAFDEQNGIMYVINGDSIWSMRYSLPVLERMIQEETPTPEG